jgi:ankyrin repeat protein
MSLEKVDLNKYDSLPKALALVKFKNPGYCFGFAHTASDCEVSPLYCAILCNSTVKNGLIIIKKLLSDERTDPNIKHYGETCLYSAVNEGKVEIVEALLKNKKTDPNLATDGETPIIVAAKKRNLKIVDVSVDI